MNSTARSLPGPNRRERARRATSLDSANCAGLSKVSLDRPLLYGATMAKPRSVFRVAVRKPVGSW